MWKNAVRGYERESELLVGIAMSHTVLDLTEAIRVTFNDLAWNTSLKGNHDVETDH
jgi:hypothetical protein